MNIRHDIFIEFEGFSMRPETLLDTAMRIESSAMLTESASALGIGPKAKADLKVLCALARDIAVNVFKPTPP